MPLTRNNKVGDLETRLGLISQMLEEAVDLLRSTMTEVREEAVAGRDNHVDERGSGSDGRRA